MVIRCKAIVLKVVNYSDKNGIAHLYTDSHGSISCLISRPTKRKSLGRSRAFYIPLTIFDLELDIRNSREVQRYSDLSIVHLPDRPMVDPVANAIVLFITEFLDRILRTSESDQSLFSFLQEEIMKIERLPAKELSSFHLNFLLRLSSHLGIVPNSDNYTQGMVLDIAEGTFRHPLSIKESREKAPIAELLYRMMIHPEDADPIPMSRNERNAILALLIRYYDNFFPGMNNLKSPDVLSEIFSE